MESSWASSSKIERSKIRLERLGYFEEVNVETPPVAGTADQIDVNYSVVEKPSGNLSAGVGFSQTQGIVLNANIAQDNVFGSGKRVNVAFNNSTYMTSYQFGFYNPYFTVDGVSQGYNLGYTKRNAGAVNIANYSTNVANAGINFGIPLNEFDSLRFDVDVKHTTLSATYGAYGQIDPGTNQFVRAGFPMSNGTTASASVLGNVPSSQQIQDFVDKNGNHVFDTGACNRLDSRYA